MDYLPFLKHVPSWMPGAGFKRKAAYWDMVNEDMIEKPFLKDQLVSWSRIGDAENSVTILTRDFSKAKGTAAPSVTVTLIENLPEESDPRRAEEDEIAKNVAAVAYVGISL